jgi:uncharacterized protein RhaS with RHS repeats
MAGDFNFYRYVGGDPVNFVDPSGLYSWSEFGYDATKNIAGVCNSITFGFSGWVGKKVSTQIYGEALANQADQAIENSFGQQATDYGMIATGVGGLAKGGAKLGKVAWKNRKAIGKIIEKVLSKSSKAIKCEAGKIGSGGVKIVGFDLKGLWGKTAKEIAEELNKKGYKTNIRQSTKGSKKATIIEVKGHKNITQIQVHPGGGIHGGGILQNINLPTGNY